jgi:hypothetical protein
MPANLPPIMTAEEVAGPTRDDRAAPNGKPTTASRRDSKPGEAPKTSARGGSRPAGEHARLASRAREAAALAGVTSGVTWGYATLASKSGLQRGRGRVVTAERMLTADLLGRGTVPPNWGVEAPSPKALKNMVGATGIETVTPTMSTHGVGKFLQYIQQFTETGDDPTPVEIIGFFGAPFKTRSNLRRRRLAACPLSDRRAP